LVKIDHFDQTSSGLMDSGSNEMDNSIRDKFGDEFYYKASKCNSIAVIGYNRQKITEGFKPIQSSKSQRNNNSLYNSPVKSISENCVLDKVQEQSEMGGSQITANSLASNCDGNLINRSLMS